MKIIAFLFLIFPFISVAQSAIELKLGQVGLLLDSGKIEKARENIKLLKQQHLPDTIYSIVLKLSAQIEEKDNNYEQAIKDYEEIQKILPKSENIEQQNIGRLKKNVGDFSGSENAFKRVIEIDPYDELVYLNLAMLYNYTNKYTEAIYILRSNPNKTKTEFIINTEYDQYSLAFLNLGKYDSAKIFIDKYLGIQSVKKDEMIYYHAAVIYSSLNDKLNACKFIQLANKFIAENKIDDLIKNVSDNIKKRWFYKKYTEDIDAIKANKKSFCN